jgi:hypothetical protein
MEVHDSPRAPDAVHYCWMGIFKNLIALAWKKANNGISLAHVRQVDYK